MVVAKTGLSTMHRSRALGAIAMLMRRCAAGDAPDASNATKVRGLSATSPHASSRVPLRRWPPSPRETRGGDFGPSTPDPEIPLPGPAAGSTTLSSHPHPGRAGPPGTTPASPVPPRAHVGLRSARASLRHRARPSMQGPGDRPVRARARACACHGFLALLALLAPSNTPLDALAGLDASSPAFSTLDAGCRDPPAACLRRGHLQQVTRRFCRSLPLPPHSQQHFSAVARRPCLSRPQIRRSWLPKALPRRPLPPSTPLRSRQCVLLTPPFLLPFASCLALQLLQPPLGPPPPPKKSDARLSGDLSTFPPHAHIPLPPCQQTRNPLFFSV